MPSSIINSDDGVVSGTAGLKTSGGDDGVLEFQNNGTAQAKITAAGLMQFNSGYGSVATAYGCRAWVNFNGTGTVAIREDGNVSSITDNGTGSYTVNFTTAMPDRNYAVTQCAGNVSTNACYLTSFYTPATGSVRLLCRSDAAITIDADECNIAIFR